jgi:hypothetical protein
MNKILIALVLAILIAGFAASSYASYKGVGLVTSGTGSTSSRGIFFIFPGGGPGGGK